MEQSDQPQSMRVDTRLVREQLVAQILGTGIERLDKVPGSVATDLKGALGKLTPEIENRPAPATQLADRMALLGYSCRMVEAEVFESARQPFERLPQEVGRDPLELATELALAEPERRPDPGEAPSWRIPGPGGHVRHYLALDAIHQLAPEENGRPQAPPGVEVAELKRSWMLGFFLRCCAETEIGTI